MTATFFSGNLANYFFQRSRHVKSCVSSSKFDKLISMVGTQLSPNVYTLITYLTKKFKEQVRFLFMCDFNAGF